MDLCKLEFLAPNLEILLWSFPDEDIDIATYCIPPDRRFHKSYSEGLQPATKENLTNAQPTREIPKGCYDVGDGFYNPRTRWVHRVGDMGQLLYMIPENTKKPKLLTESR